jgi:hypothetical protein
VEKSEKMQGSEEEKFTTFEDIFALALANTKGLHFKADSDEWHKVLYEMCEKYRDKVPQLRVIFFEERPPLPPQSDEFYQLITTLSMSGLISLPNPNYELIVMNEEQKKRAREMEGKRLDKYEGYIQEISKLLDARLAVPG